jgi:hypothetical protein
MEFVLRVVSVSCVCVCVFVLCVISSESARRVTLLELLAMLLLAVLVYLRQDIT